jgi:hypothetical protein
MALLSNLKVQDTETQQLTNINIKDPKDSHKTLGTHQNPAGDPTYQSKIAQPERKEDGPLLQAFETTKVQGLSSIPLDDSSYTHTWSSSHRVCARTSNVSFFHAGLFNHLFGWSNMEALPQCPLQPCLSWCISLFFSQLPQNHPNLTMVINKCQK